jgi:hypothetical protein
MGGQDIRTVQELLGHKSITMTLRYSHLLPTHRAKAVATLDGARAQQQWTLLDTRRSPPRRPRAKRLISQRRRGGRVRFGDVPDVASEPVAVAPRPEALGVRPDPGF